MNWFHYRAVLDGGTLPEPGHWAVLAGIGVILAFLVRVAYKDLKRPDRVPDDAGPHPRLKLFRETIASLWITAVAVTAAWVLGGGGWTALGFGSTGGVGGWIAWGLTLLGCALLGVQLRTVAVSEEARRTYAEQLDTFTGYDWIRPSTTREYTAFQVMAVTAGVTEEVIFRGFLIGALSLWLPVWAAAVLAIAVFVGGHIYQGASGMMRILPISGLLTLIFLLGGSLLPGIVLHAVVDVVGGAVMWRLRGYRGTTGGPGAGGSVENAAEDTGADQARAGEGDAGASVTTSG